MRAILLALFMCAGLFVLQAIHYFQFQDQVQQFQSKGPRFTAIDGQSLCERVAKLEKEPQPCEYANAKPR